MLDQPFLHAAETDSDEHIQKRLHSLGSSNQLHSSETTELTSSSKDTILSTSKLQTTNETESEGTKIKWYFLWSLWREETKRRVMFSWDEIIRVIYK